MVFLKEEGLMVEALFEPYRIKKVELPNRFAMAPMTRKRSPGGVPTEVVADYYRRRAAGGVGLIITEGTLPDHPLAAHDTDIPRIDADTVEAWRRVLEEIHTTPSKAFVQIWHQGPKANPGIAAFALEEDGKQIVEAATETTKQELFDAFLKAGVLAQEIGFDGIELHGAHGYLLDSFLRDGQVDYVCRLVSAIRAEVGVDYPIGIRFSQWGVGDFGARQFDSADDLKRALLPLRDAGIDLFHASTRRFWVPEFEGSDLNLAGWTRQITDTPTMTVGNIGLVTEEFFGEGPEGAGELMRRYDRGEFDMVAIGRPLITDPEWVNKVRDGRKDEIVEFDSDKREVFP